jgi:hypothetical protein
MKHRFYFFPVFTLRFLFVLALLFGQEWARAQNWTRTNGPTPHTGDVQCLLASGSDLFAGTIEDGVFLTTNNGATWSAVNSGLLIGSAHTAVYALAMNGTNLFAGTNSGVFLSTNNGTAWSTVNNGLPNNSTPEIWALDTLGSNLFAGSDGQGVFLSTNQGASWTQVWTKVGLSYVTVFAFAVIGSNLFAGVAAGATTGAFLSTDNGSSWAQVLTTAGAEVTSFAVIGSNLFAGTEGNGIFLSSDTGVSWVAVNNGLSNADVISLTVSGTVLLAGTYNGVFRSTDSGASWTPFDIGLPSDINDSNEVSALASNGADLFAGLTYDSVFRLPLCVGASVELDSTSQQAGHSVNILLSIGSSALPLNADSMQVTLVYNNNLLSYDSVIAGCVDSVKIAPIDSMHTLVTLYFLPGYMLSDSSCVVADIITTVMVTGDRATDVGVESLSLLNAGISTLATTCSVSSSFSISNSCGESILQQFLQTGALLTLISTYPNPFSSTSTLKYSLREASPVNIIIYNVLGIEAANPLMNEAQDAGEHEVLLDANTLAPGIYECRFAAGGESQTTNIVVLK